MTPFYRHLAGIPGFGVQSNIDKVGVWATVGVGAAFAAHGLISLAKRWKAGAAAPPPPRAAGEAGREEPTRRKESRS